MNLRRQLLFLFPLFMAGSSFAYVSEAQDFRSLLRHVGDGYAFTAMWIDTLQRGVGPDCKLKVNKAILTLWISRTNNVQRIGPVLATYRNGVDRNQMLDDWRAMFSADAAASCKMATGLWGEDGVLVPGILEQKM